MSSDRRTRSLDERPPQSQSQATASAPRSLDGVALGTYPREVIQRAYADLYASSYASSDSEPNSDTEVETRPPAQSFGSPPIEAKVLRFQSAAPRMPAVRVGAARLSEMMMYNRRAQQPDDAGSSAGASKIKTADHQSFAGPAPEQPFADGMSSGLEPGDAEARSVANTDECEPQTPRARRSLSTPAPPPLAQTLHADAHAAPLQLPNDLHAGIDDYNGLVAPGAMADEKQKSKADGKTPFHAFLQLLRNNDSRAQEEARLFKPTVLSTSKARAADPFALDAFDENTRTTIMSKFPFCCCAARYCVAISFAAVLISALLGFFLWPRVPTVSINSLTPLSAAHVTYDTRQNVFGLWMPVQISYEIHSGNFYPLMISSIRVSGFDGITGNRIVDTTLRNIHVKQSRLQFYKANTDVHYLTSDMTDPALVDLFGKCAPRSALRQIRFSQAQSTGRPGALTIRFQIRLDVRNLGWIRQPIVTLNQNVNCPE
ncbi:hypothetical protein H4R99_000452 [Coemansia sp. RSA 1722]|nr:hypothetical protein IWW45_007342 [Coemansia sp. RSA 485]KAJ2606431.1 hypothetical protein H4R99_000452 [Coemansia sp. RSA 1722]KAJ2636104.1 hypothetical protein GGF40_003209 [Coemansia sp. RSA 1286]